MNFKRTMSLWAVLLIIVIAITTASIPIALGAKFENPVSLNNQPVSLSNQSEEDALLFDAEMYAKQHGVTVDEAIRRFQLQDYAGVLGAELTSEESDTFAGLWIEHTPEFRIVVQFTRDAAEKIRPYIKENMVDIIEVRAAKTSLVDLQSAQSNVLSSVRSLGILADSEIDVRENRVKVYVTDRSKIDNALRDGKLILPDNVDIITVEALAKPG
jgi:hypothetical protein